MTYDEFRKHLDGWADLQRNTFGSEPTVQEFAEYTAFFQAVAARRTYQQQQNQNQ
jgi:hypothetical protein